MHIKYTTTQYDYQHFGYHRTDPDQFMISLPCVRCEALLFNRLAFARGFACVKLNIFVPDFYLLGVTFPKLLSWCSLKVYKNLLAKFQDTRTNLFTVRNFFRVCGVVSKNNNIKNNRMERDITFTWIISKNNIKQYVSKNIALKQTVHIISNALSCRNEQ